MMIWCFTIVSVKNLGFLVLNYKCTIKFIFTVFMALFALFFNFLR